MDQGSSFERCGWMKPIWSLGELQWDDGLQRPRQGLGVSNYVCTIRCTLHELRPKFLGSKIQSSLCFRNLDIKWKACSSTALALPTARSGSNYLVYWAFVSSSVVSGIKYCTAFLDGAFWKSFWLGQNVIFLFGVTENVFLLCLLIIHPVLDLYVCCWGGSWTV